MKQRGFSLLELLIVCIIVIILVAMAVPNAAKIQMSFNQVNARQHLATIGQALVVNTLCGTMSNPPASCASIPAMIPTQPWIASGYVFTPVVGATYSLTAMPSIPNQSGMYSYYTDGSGFVRCNSTGGALGPTSTVCQ